MYGEIVRAVEKLKRKYMETDPARLCRSMGIILRPAPLGTGPDSIKGFYLEHSRIRTITINSELPELIGRFIIFHELGHAVLHHKSGLHAFHDVGLFDGSSRYERDANLFAAEYLLDDDDVLRTLDGRADFFSSAAELLVPPELLDFKFRIMEWKGYRIAEPPITARSDFLKDVEVPYGMDDHIC